MTVIDHNLLLQEANLTKPRDGWQTFFHDHPTCTKVIKIALFIFAALLISALPVSIPLLGVSVAVISCGIASTLLGLLILRITLLAHYYIGALCPGKHEMSKHAFVEGEHQGSTLRYVNDVPILTLKGSAQEQGYAHGYLLGPSIQQVRRCLQKLPASMRAHSNWRKTPHLLAALKERLPDSLKEELEGLVEGYNAWAKGNNPLTEEEVLLFHLLPDSIYFNPVREEQHFGGQKELSGSAEGGSTVACSVIAVRDEKAGVVVGRQMDWPSYYGTLAAHSLMIVREVEGKKIADLTFPSCLGTLTGMDSNGFSVIMNVSPGETSNRKQGLPAAFVNRLCLERCKKIDDVAKVLQEHPPLGPYHLTVADGKGVQTQIVGCGADPRRLEGRMLVVTNSGNGQHMFSSEEREQLIAKLFETYGELPQKELVKQALSLPYVNNNLSLHSVMLYPGKGSMEVAFDNGYAGSQPRQELTGEELFGVTADPME